MKDIRIILLHVEIMLGGRYRCKEIYMAANSLLLVGITLGVRCRYKEIYVAANSLLLEAMLIAKARESILILS